MNHLKYLYRYPLALLTDLYQLTMAYSYWRAQRDQQQAVFTLFFRQLPFGSGYAIAAGLETVLEYLTDLHFTTADLDYLATLTGVDDQPLFEQAFLDYLDQLRFQCDIDAIPEGTLVFPHEPLLRVQGPLLHGQLLETALLNIINFQTLIATKATRVCQATQGEPILEFGLRRAQGIDGALAASRAAYLGGCVATSNVLAGKLYDIPVKGTHAHSWIMSFTSEMTAFETYAAAMPNNCIFLVDTFNTLEGVKKAIQVGYQLQAQGHQLVGIRLDSGDLATLSQQARTLLDAAGFHQARIVASNDLDEYTIAQLKAKGAAIDTWGVGTKLITAYDQPALGGVYKLTAIRDDPMDAWQYRLKLSDEPAKVSNPGMLQVRRFKDMQGMLHSDMLYDQLHAPTLQPTLFDFEGKKQVLPENSSYEDLLIPVWRQGQPVTTLPTLSTLRERVQAQLANCPEEIKSLANPAPYPVGLEARLFALKTDLMAQAKNKTERVE